MTADEIEATIERAEARRPELANRQPPAKASPKVLAMLPAAGEIYRQSGGRLVMFRPSQYETA